MVRSKTDAEALGAVTAVIPRPFNCVHTGRRWVEPLVPRQTR